MQHASAALFFAVFAAGPVAGAELPDTSERFREAMSACTLPGPGIEPRLTRLESVGWTAQPATPDLRATYVDAMTVHGQAQSSAAETIATRRAYLAEGTETIPADAIFANGRATVLATPELETGFPSCFLMTLNSRESDLLFGDLEGAGATEPWGVGRRAQMYTVQTDAEGRDWRTDVALFSVSAPDTDPPLRTTLTATFVTRPER